MFPKITLAVGVAMTMLMCAAVTAAAKDAPAYNDISKIRCVCSYTPGSAAARGVDAWRRDLDGMKAAGFNTVWLVNVWQAFVPNVDTGEYILAETNMLRTVCREAKKRNMKVMLVLGYVGEGWAPKGIDEQIWPLTDDGFNHYKEFVGSMAALTRDFNNVIFMLSNEEILSGTILYTPDKRPECVEAFRAWARSVNPDVDYWNQRWNTRYTWDNLSPVSTTQRHTWQCWLDHWRWAMSTLGPKLPELVQAIRSEKPDAIVGFHDFLVYPEIADINESSVPNPDPFNFYSSGYYYGGSNSDEEIDKGIKALSDHIAVMRRLVANRPFFLGELGANIRMSGDDGQKKFLEKALAVLGRENMGWSVWNWRYYPQGPNKDYFSLLDESGKPRPALTAMIKANKE